LYELEGRNLKGIGPIGEKAVDGPGVRLWRISWLIFLLGQGLLAMAWWWLSPGGFGLGAGTSVGRGWDCVGHKAGTYRNRMRLEGVGLKTQPQSGGRGSAATGNQGSHAAQMYLTFKA
jgi:hypothetical protein